MRGNAIEGTIGLALVVCSIATARAQVFTGDQCSLSNGVLVCPTATATHATTTDATTTDAQATGA